MGAKREVFVKTATGYDRREVKLGLYNDKMVEIREGLAEGDEIVVNPEGAPRRQGQDQDAATPATRRTAKIRTPTRPTPSRGDAGPGGGPTKGGFPGGGEPPRAREAARRRKRAGSPVERGGGGPPVGT